MGGSKDKDGKKGKKDPKAPADDKAKAAAAPGEDAKASKKRPKPKTFFKHLPVKLTAVELARRGDRLAKMNCELQLEIDRQKDRAAASKAKQKEIKDEIVDLSRQVIFAKEERQVKCIDIPDYKTNSIMTKRLDTKEICDQRPMTYADRQEVLAFDEKNKSPNDKTKAEAEKAAGAVNADKVKTEGAAKEKKAKAPKKTPDGKPSLTVVKDEPKSEPSQSNG